MCDTSRSLTIRMSSSSSANKAQVQPASRRSPCHNLMARGSYRRLAGIAVIVLLGTMTATAQAVSIQFEGGLFKVSGWKPPSAAPAGGWNSLFAVYAGSGVVPALLGSYAVERDILIFRPSFPIAQ